MRLHLKTTSMDETGTIDQTSPSLQAPHLAEGGRFPALMARADPGTRKRFLEFFTVNIRNPNTRAACGLAAAAFLNWCKRRGLAVLIQIPPIHADKKRCRSKRNPAMSCVLAILGLGTGATLLAASFAARPARPDANASRAAFLEVYRVLTSPRCQNCHPAGDAPLQGDDSHVHLQNVKRGKDGHGVYGMRCDTCHQATNLAGAHMPPGNPKWALPSPEHKMVFAGRSAGELCRQIKDPKQNGGRSPEALLDHVANDDLVGWGWSPGEGRTLPPLSRPETVAQMKIWIGGGAACPQ